MNGLRWWLHSYLAVGDDSRLDLFLLVSSHPLQAFTWQWLHSEKEELKQSGSSELRTPIVSLLSYCIGQSKSRSQLRSSREIDPTPPLFMGGDVKYLYKGEVCTGMRGICASSSSSNIL